MDFQFKRFDALTPREVYEILAARAEIFAVEQGICCLDPDGVDLDALHVFSMEKERVTAYLRAFYTDESHETVSIGRVLTRVHGIGHGRALMEATLAALPHHLPAKRLVMHAQTHAIGFYEKLGFSVCSDVFLEENVPHVTMERYV